LDATAISFGKFRKESIKAYGNAIVPQVAYQIFKTIEQYEHINEKKKRENSNR
jgi:DNA (cytosine-5)-methyltransferase 1